MELRPEGVFVWKEAREVLTRGVRWISMFVRFVGW
jgi:hypothetical protein